MMQQHSNRPQFFKMKGESVIICESVNKKFLTQTHQGKYISPSKFVGDKDDFLTVIKTYLSKYDNKFQQDFVLIGFIKMESQIKEDTFEQYIRNVFYVRFYGDDTQISDFKTFEEIQNNTQDQSFLNYLSYIKNGGLAYPTSLFVYEGQEVTLPECKTPYQKQKLQEMQQQMKNNTYKNPKVN